MKKHSVTIEPAQMKALESEGSIKKVVMESGAVRWVLTDAGRARAEVGRAKG